MFSKFPIYFSFPFFILITVPFCKRNRDIFQPFSHLYESSNCLDTYKLWRIAFNLDVPKTQDWQQTRSRDLDPGPCGCFFDS